MVNTYHQISDPPAYFRRMVPQLRNHARVVIVNFRMGEIPIGPPESMRIEPDQVISEMKQAGFAHVATYELPYQYALVSRGTFY